jgi:hypothetical protein
MTISDPVRGSVVDVGEFGWFINEKLETRSLGKRQGRDRVTGV